ncbi:MAG: Mov34/MPN/PAD-1 family protein [SAR324 cluster bacterium]|nr:Mov34/MPN/PAD-1 family protein [SAR324 cluster bacterium]
MIAISREILDQCYSYGIEAYPEEACGMISGKIEDDQLEEVHPMKNLMDQYHAQDPELYPRNNRNAYMIEPIEQVKLERGLKKRQRRIKIIFHSHPDVGAYFSDKDKSDALWNGEPRQPNIQYLVCGIKNKQRDGAILATYSSEKKDFDVTRID